MSQNSPSTSLAAAAILNAGLQNDEKQSQISQDSPSRARRRSSVRLNLALNNPSLTAPGEMIDSNPIRHNRQPSLGELHQELENEQEAQVNRLLGMIRQQHSQIQQLQSQSQPQTQTQPQPQSQNPIDITNTGPNRSRNSSILINSTNISPSIRPNQSHNLPMSQPLDDTSSASSLRDQSLFYQAETQTLIRENQMLKLRIRELEKQLNELSIT